MSNYYPDEAPYNLPDEGLSAQGMVFQTFDRRLPASAAATVLGDTRFMLCKVRGGVPITTIAVIVGSNPTATLVRAGFCTIVGANAVPVAATADFSAACNTGSAPRVVTANLSSPWTPVGTQDVYAYFLMVGSAAGTMLLLGVTNANALPVNSANPPVGLLAAQTDIPAAPFAISSLAVSAQVVWIGGY